MKNYRDLGRKMVLGAIVVGALGVVGCTKDPSLAGTSMTGPSPISVAYEGDGGGPMPPDVDNGGF